FWPKVICIIGNGVVVNPEPLLTEMDELEAKGVDTSRLLVSDRAHLIMPYHVLLDSLEEKARGAKAIGTTGKGIGPAYVDKAARIGIRVGELLHPESLLPRLEAVVTQKNVLITKVYEQPPISTKEIFDKCVAWGQRLRPHIAATESILFEALAQKKRILLEGAQGTLLDLDHGTYPYVTSSSPSIGGACTGLGLTPHAITGIIGIFKAYCTRVGGGPFPTEMHDKTGELIRERAWEYGATTGRPRRVGWFDGVAGRYSQLINGYTSLCITRLDVLDGFPCVKICRAYKVDGVETTQFPGNISLLERAEPVYEEMEGWEQPTASRTLLEDLPPQAVRYVRRLEELVGAPVHIISTGPKREETIQIKPIL
ncbi:MAG: adenylosuccinate synthase, partial [Chloroflexota bacterium]|nr:adenylosuccinate synthase [Chloroflexota bacterium]